MLRLIYSSRDLWIWKKDKWNDTFSVCLLLKENEMWYEKKRWWRRKMKWKMMKIWLKAWSTCGIHAITLRQHSEFNKLVYNNLRNFPGGLKMFGLANEKNMRIDPCLYADVDVDPSSDIVVVLHLQGIRTQFIWFLDSLSTYFTHRDSKTQFPVNSAQRFIFHNSMRRYDIDVASKLQFSFPIFPFYFVFLSSWYSFCNYESHFHWNKLFAFELSHELGGIATTITPMMVQNSK